MGSRKLKVKGQLATPLAALVCTGIYCMFGCGLVSRRVNLVRCLNLNGWRGTKGDRVDPLF